MGAPVIEAAIPMPDDAAAAVRSLAQIGLPPGAEASMEALMAVYQIGVAVGRAQALSEVARERNSAHGLPWFLRRQAQ